MDETQSTKVSDTAASRKRRSSILKSQRAPRTPFSELEFNVATPTDTGKSRRVSFSRRTGVAEFVTNEATTTWKNFYEEHNKSLESSGNESAANAPRPSISHIGKRIFDQQFEEVEVVDYESAMMPGSSRTAEFNLSINNVNLTQQLAAFECTVDDNKLTAPQQHFELSSLTDHQNKVFSDDLTIPVIGELSNQINVNFSLMNPIGVNSDKCDDLDEIQKDVERSHNVGCPGPFREPNMSEYIEVDLNMTHVPVANDESDMSITDTVHSPKVQEISSISVKRSKQSVVDKDWTTDKENIAVLNPYVAPRESDNFAINDIPDQVLVFDGKRLTVQSERNPVEAEISIRDKKLTDEGNLRRTMPSDAHLDNIPQRKTIVLNTNDDLPNFSDDCTLLHHRDIGNASAQELKHTIIFDKGDLSMTQAVQNVVEPSHVIELLSKRKTFVSGNTTGNISLTQAVPSNVILDNNVTREKRKTIIYDDSHGNISMTQAISANVLLDNKIDFNNKRKSTVYDGENITFTEVLPANIILPQHDGKSDNKTILYQNNMEDISFTQVITNNIHLEKSHMNKTTVFEKSVSNISMTEVIPSNIIVFDSEAVSNKRKTIVYENDDADISMTQAIPANLIITEKSQVGESVTKGNSEIFVNDTDNAHLSPGLPDNILQQEVCNKADCAIEPPKIYDNYSSENSKESQDVTKKAELEGVSIYSSKNISNRRLTIAYDNHDDISLTQALPTNVLCSDHSKSPNDNNTIVFVDDNCSASGIKTVSNDVLSKGDITRLSKINQNNDICTTQILTNTSDFAMKGLIIDNDESDRVAELKHHISANTKQVIDKNDVAKSEIGNVTTTKPIPGKIFEIENELLEKDIKKINSLTEFGENTLPQDISNVDVLVYQTNTNNISELKEITTDLEDSKQDKSKKCTEFEKTDTRMVESHKNLTSLSNHSEVMKEKDSNVQIKLQDKVDNLVIEYNDEKSSWDKILQNSKGKKSLLHELLDMSSTSVINEISNKNFTAQVDIKNSQEESLEKSNENDLNDDIFIVDKDEENQIESQSFYNSLSPIKKLNLEKMDGIENKLPALEYNTENEKNIEDKIFELTGTVNEIKRSPQQNRYYEQILSSDLQANSHEDTTKVKEVKTRKSFKEADNTRELLEILSDLTNKKSVDCIEDDDKVKSSQVHHRRSMTLKHKTEISEPKRLNFAPNRRSIVLTREELLNDLSMAQATLQQSRFDIEDSEVDDTATDSPLAVVESINSPKKSVRISNEVVKTLHFEDESCSDMSLKSDVKMTPLKKTAFGETSYMKDCKANVIPTYLKDVSDNIKALMSDLVKPRPDQMPFEVITTHKTKRKSSTCSTQIQTNLVTSSQIDLDVELQSKVNSVYELAKSKSLVSDVAVLGNNAVDRALQEYDSPVKDISETELCSKLLTVKFYEGNSSITKESKKPVLVFDHNNPLNNVLLAPPDCVDIHKYNPLKSIDVLSTEDDNNEEPKSKKDNQIEVERVVTQYNVESLVGLQSGDACDKKGDANSLFSDPSKPLSMDRSTEGFAMEVKNIEVNTVIAMKVNKELLEASSSLTLVDDALTQNVFDLTVETRLINRNSPVKVIYKMDDEDVTMLENIDSDLISNDDEPMEYPKAKKRSYSPSRSNTRPSTLSSADVTPTPASKMQKRSTSPDVRNNMLEMIEDATETSEKTDNNSIKECRKKRSPRKSKSNPKYKKLGTDVTVQQMITEYNITQMEQDMIEDQIMEAMHERMSLNGNLAYKVRDRSPDVASSCTSSKHQNEMQEASVKETVSYVGSQPSRVDWQPDLKELSSSNILTESGVNVVAKIDMLPFMGSKECEWETSGGDMWVFRLLRARLRLRVRLAHRHHNALRTRVRADTPVTEICVDAVPAEEKDPLVALCVRFAAEAMRYECGRGCARAGDVPPVLRRCAGVARVALRWARAMRDARFRLAYTLTPDGLLTLKVANVALRSVWEVSMRLELVVEDAREVAWPRASEVRVRRVLADTDVGEDETQRALRQVARDWGHAPRTIWKIFRYLKNKKQDDFLAL